MSPSNFFNFLFFPAYPVSDRKETNIFTKAIKIYLLYVLFTSIAYALITLFLKTFITLPADETFGIPAKFKDRLWSYAFVVAFIGPIAEETMFRLSLRFKPIYFSLSLAVMAGLISREITGKLNSLLIFILIFMLIYQIASRYSSFLESFWKNHFRCIFYFFPILFGLVHIFNYRFTDVNQYWIAPLLVFPQLALGFVLSVTRIYYKKGFLLGILVHVLLNSIAVSITLLQFKG
jgi:hypothetical protein